MSMKHNPNKSISASSHGITISYTDSHKHYNIAYDKEKKNILSNLQTQGNKFNGKSYQRIGIKDSPLQQKLYRTALYGLTVFTPEELGQMSFMEKNKITNTQKKVQTFLDHWKQELCHQKLGSFLTTVFRNSVIAKQLANYSEYIDNDNKNKLDFKDLGITKEMRIRKLISVNLLPQNFYELV